LIWRELELLALRHIHETFLGELVLLQVRFVEIDASLKNWNELFWWVGIVVPKGIIRGQIASLWILTFTNQTKVQNVGSAVLDHLIRDLYKQAGHSLIGIIVPSNRVDHLDTVHKSWKRLLDCLWRSIVQWLDEFLKGLEVLDIVLSLVKGFSDSELNASPLGG
jgi:hypothetical protein